MGPIAALDSVFTKFFTLKGRAPRSEYWWFILMTVLILFVAIFADLALMDPDNLSLNPLSYFTTMWLLITIIPNFTCSIRRLHDSDRSGLYYLVKFVPVIGGIWFLILMCMDSDYRDNSYGPTPFGKRGSSYKGVSDADLGIADVQAQTQKEHNPYAGYALLDKARQEPTPDMIAARKEAVSELYRTRVLGQQPTPQEG